MVLKTLSLLLHLITTIWAIFIGFLVFTAMNIWSIPAFLFPKKRRESFYFFSIPFLTGSLLKWGTLSRIIHIDRREAKNSAPPTSRLYIANHRSMIDVPLLNTAHPVTTLMKFEVFYLPFMILPSLASGAIAVKRGNSQSRKRAFMTSISRLKNGKPVFYFPEGTRARDGYVKKYELIHKPLLKAAYGQQASIIPISVAGTKEILDDHNFIRPFQKLVMITHDYVHAKDFTNEDDFCQACWEKVVSGVYEAEKLRSGEI